MKVAIVVSSLEGGGTERFAVRLADGLTKLDSKVVLITLVSSLRDVYEPSKTVVRFSLDGDLGASPLPWSRVRRTFRTSWRLRKVLRRENVDVILALGTATNLLVLLSTLGLRVPVVVSERSDPRMHIQPGLIRTLRMLVYRRARRVIVQTEAVASVAEKWVSPKRIVVLPNPAPEISSPTQLSPAVYPHVVAMGRLSAEKGFDSLVRAFEIVNKKRQDSRLTILGEGPERDSLNELIHSLNLQEVVHLKGFVFSPSELLATGWVFVLPSRFEGFPNALLEALSLGLPCISTDCLSGPQEILGHEAGLLVPVDDQAGMAEAVLTVLGDEQRRRSMSKQSQTRAELFRHETVIIRWHKILRSVLGTT